LEGTPGYAIAWAQENGSGYQNKLMRNTNFYSEYTLNTTGSAIELNNAALFSNMFGYALHTGSAPYYFGKSQFVNTLQKEQLNNMTAARSGVLYSGNAQFMFSFGDISVNNAPVFFPVIPDTMRLTGLEELKHYLVSDPFMLENQSGFMYSVQYRAVDTGSCSAVLGAEGEVNFRLVLEDSNSGEVLGEYDNITFTQNDLTKYDNISYEVNTAGIGSRLVRLRLIPYTSAELTPSLITRVRSAEEQAKGSLKRIHYNGAEPIKDYSLTQNYPNPFNPVTMIEFALPEQSDISLKVYDILGKEIATLASGSYSAGRYTVPFDGTNHASGVYIYKLSYGKGQSITRKMTLLK
ncbi:MAG: T9SS type A sorting domain-containing protein, partial [Ignavibacteriaceae bacterium]|nr:T9SS type A sorting domain-containing protein [Ignavibacteriaceae bacterium]